LYVKIHTTRPAKFIETIDLGRHSYLRSGKFLYINDTAREARAVAKMAAAREKAKCGTVEAFFCWLQWRPWVS